MPATYRFDDRIVVLELIGQYTMDEIRATILNSLADSGRPANSYLLIDLGRSRSIHDRTSDEIRSMANFIGTLGERFNNRIALVGPSDFTFGLARMGSVGSEERGIQSEVFRSVAEARKWLLS